jgi:hypothetical protein
MIGIQMPRVAIRGDGVAALGIISRQNKATRVLNKRITEMMTMNDEERPSVNSHGSMANAECIMVLRG